ncbi:MAG TPA: hypothetical protein VFT67_18350 [Jatrophihabitantaceae bacterium]|nr:hypothetical protein [Jatrophihabitantaceae bacterium]
MGTATAPHPVEVTGHGLRALVPHPWEARLYRRDDPEVNEHGELAHPVLHVANFALPPGRGDFGTGAVEVMGPEHVFVSLLEFERAEAFRPLFAHRGVPRPRPSDFGANALQRRLPGQGGWQGFFTENGRPFCLYVVLGSLRQAHRLVPQLHGVLDELRIGAR